MRVTSAYGYSLEYVLAVGCAIVALSVMAFSDNTCSKTAEIPEGKPFSEILLANMNSCGWKIRIPWNNLRAHSVGVNSCSQSQICWGVVWHKKAVSKVH